LAATGAAGAAAGAVALLATFLVTLLDEAGLVAWAALAVLDMVESVDRDETTILVPGAACALQGSFTDSFTDLYGLPAS